MTYSTSKVRGASSPNETSRDVYGFTIRPHQLKHYKQFAEIYKEEEAERSSRWEEFLSTYGDFVDKTSLAESHGMVESTRMEVGFKRNFEKWCHTRSTLQPVERALEHRFKKSPAVQTNDSLGTTVSGLVTRVETYGASSPTKFMSGGSEDDSDDEFYDVERSDTVQDEAQGSIEFIKIASDHGEESCPWKQELDALVRGGVPMALRGEVWQVFTGSSSRRVYGHYQALLTLLADGGGDGNGSGGLCNQKSSDYKLSDSGILEKWTNQIEKDLPRTFPGHPALGVDGRNALRRLLTAYARHNPNVGYCQAMNFFAGLLLLMMPEENAFWTLTGVLDDCFEGYYTEKMSESQVDQLVLEELIRKHFPRLIAHLETLGVQVAWVSGPWFLSIFVNVLPWESVLRVWDVLLYEGNRSMLFRTTLALLELHGSMIMSTKDAGDAMTMLQSLASETFDSSQLVLTACVGYQFVNESQLQELRQKHRPQVLAAFTKCLIDQFKGHKDYGRETSAHCEDSEKKNSIACQSGDAELDNGIVLTDLVNQVKYLKLELSRALEERRTANLRAEELEIAFMEVVKEDNRRLLSAKVETLEAEAAYLKRALADKMEQERAMIQVMVRMEQEQRTTEDAREFAENDAKAQRSALYALEAKNESIVSSLKELEKRAAIAESMLESTSQYPTFNNGEGIPSKSASQGEESSRWAWAWNTSK